MRSLVWKTIDFLERYGEWSDSVFSSVVVDKLEITNKV